MEKLLHIIYNIDNNVKVKNYLFTYCKIIFVRIFLYNFNKKKFIFQNPVSFPRNKIYSSTLLIPTTNK